MTETDTQLALDYKSHFRTSPLTDAGYYRATENRVTIFTNYGLIRQHETFDDQTAVCVEWRTDHGNLLVYGVVIGIYGNRHKNYATDLPRILADIERFAESNERMCVCGDFNCSFSDNYYYTKVGRMALAEALLKFDLALLTMDQPECIDHIAISRGFIRNAEVLIAEWNLGKKLSDHKGIMAEISQVRL